MLMCPQPVSLNKKKSLLVHLGPGVMSVIIVFNECGSHSEMMASGTSSYNWVKVWKYLTLLKNTSMMVWCGVMVGTSCYASAFKIVCIYYLVNVYWPSAAQQMVC